MAEPHVISALVKKRGELAGELAEIDKRRREITGRIAHVDSVLTMFGYEDDPKAITARRKQTGRLFKRGQLRRMIYDLRRERPDLALNKQIAAEVIKRLGWDTDDATLLANVSEKVKDIRKVIG
ncbi:MAG: hypothetical protein KDK75_05160 [Alphaproteobacteria bacterium]|nr:hypothetical protein [Alphaproteobacteria bacterium]